MTGSSKTSLTPQQLRRYAARLRGEQFRPLLPRDWQLERAIRKLTAAGTPEAIDPLCRFWMENGKTQDDLISLLLDAGYAPSEPAERALFWLLSEKIQRYEELDLDGTLLTQAHATASPGLRKRLATAAAAAGRMEWLGVMETAKPLNAFSEDDWATTVQVLKRAGDVEAIWRWALKAPPIHSRSLLRKIPAGTPPPAQFGEAAVGLLRLAHALTPEKDEKLYVPEFCTHTLSIHSGRNYSIAWSPDGRCFATIDCNDTIRLWVPATGTCTQTLTGHTGEVVSIAWSPDGRCFASGSWYETIRLWNPATGTCTRTLSGHNGPVENIAWSPDGRCLASSGDDKIRLWNPTTGAYIRTLTGHTDLVGCIAWSPDRRCFASSGRGFDDTIRLWDPVSGACTHTLAGNSGYAYKIAWSPDGRCLASGDSDETIRLWDPATGACTNTLSAHLTVNSWIHWSPDGRWLAFGVSDPRGSDQTIRVWDPASGACTNTLSGHSRWVYSIAWSPDGRCFASNGSDDTIRLWNPTTGAYIRALTGHTGEVVSIAWSPDGRCIASIGSDRTIRMWGNKLDNLSSTPLAFYSIDQWNLLSNLQEQNKELEKWKRPWIAFIAALGLLVRRFDVSLDNQSSKTASSIFDIEIDG